MSVIAKMNITSVTPYGVGRAVQLSCVASNETMAGFPEGKSEEDRLFSMASPSGSMILNQPVGYVLGKPRHEPGRGEPNPVRTGRARWERPGAAST